MKKYLYSFSLITGTHKSALIFAMLLCIKHSIVLIWGSLCNFYIFYFCILLAQFCHPFSNLLAQFITVLTSMVSNAEELL